jgi:hypothetical protein
VLKDSNDVLIGTYDNVTGINSNFVNYNALEEIQTATAGQTVFNLTNSYQPGTNTLSVFVDGVNQYDGSSYSYVETNSTRVTFNAGLHVGALVKFTTATTLSAGVVSSNLVTYQPAGTGAVATTVQAKLRQYASVKDFVATGDGTTDDTAAVSAAILASSGKSLYFPPGSYLVTSTITFTNLSNMTLFGDPFASKITVNTSFDLWIIDNTCSNIEINGLEFAGASTTNDNKNAIHTYAPKTVLQNCYIHNWTKGFANSNEVANDCKVINNYFKNIGSAGAGSGNGYAVYNIGLRLIVTGNTFENVARHDVYLSGSSPQGSQYCVIANNTSVNNGTESIALYNVSTYDGVRYCTVANNTIKNCQGSRAIGLDVNTCDNVVIGNTIINPAQYGIFLEGGVVANSYPNRNTITGNVIIDPGYFHIYSVNGSGNMFSGNVLSSVAVTPTDQNGIVITYSGSPTTFPTGNIIGNNSYVGITGRGTIDVNPSTGVYCGINVYADQVLWVTATNNSTTPSVKAAKHIILNNSSTTSITNLTDGYEGQEVTLYFNNGNTTITLANFFLQGFVPFVGTQYDTLTVIKKGSNWFEKCRSVN